MSTRRIVDRTPSWRSRHDEDTKNDPEDLDDWSPPPLCWLVRATEDRALQIGEQCYLSGDLHQKIVTVISTAEIAGFFIVKLKRGPKFIVPGHLLTSLVKVEAEKQKRQNLAEEAKVKAKELAEDFQTRLDRLGITDLFYVSLDGNTYSSTSGRKWEAYIQMDTRGCKAPGGDGLEGVSRRVLERLEQLRSED